MKFFLKKSQTDPVVLEMKNRNHIPTLTNRKFEKSHETIHLNLSLNFILGTL